MINLVTVMELSLKMVLIACPMIFLAGFVDAIGGGGGLISLPGYLFAGLPAHAAVATNKLSSAIGTSFSCYKYFKNGYADLKLAVPGIIMALIGAQVGAHFALIVSDEIFRTILLIALPVIAIYTFFKKDLNPDLTKIPPRHIQYILVALISLTVGAYDGFYGPGAGTFFILLYTSIVKMDVLTASGNTKLVNLASNISALCAFIIGGEVYFKLGLITSIFSIAGHLCGSSLAIKKGSKLVRYIILAVIGILTVKMIIEIM